MNNDIKELIKTYDDYLEFLKKSNEEPLSIAWAHGYKCPEELIVQGHCFRENINNLKKRVT